MTITKDMMVADVISQDEKLTQVFYQHGLFCLGCSMAHGESLEQACEAHGLDLAALLTDLNNALTSA